MTQESTDRTLTLARWRTETAPLPTAEFLAWALQTLPAPLVFATSLGAEDQVLLYLLEQALAQVPAAKPQVITLDTGRLPQETYDVLQANRDFFQLTIQAYFPQAEAVESLTQALGPNPFYASIEVRKACCQVRKVAPLRRALAGKSAWLTGQRREQSPTRQNLERVEWDAAHSLWKLNPLSDWSRPQVWQVIRAQNLPYNALHDRGYPSLGCAPCTRAVAEGGDERAGRWWWEKPEHKECGLHGNPDSKAWTFAPLGSTDPSAV